MKIKYSSIIFYLLFFTVSYNLNGQILKDIKKGVKKAEDEINSVFSKKNKIDKNINEDLNKYQSFSKTSIIFNSDKIKNFELLTFKNCPLIWREGGDPIRSNDEFIKNAERLHILLELNVMEQIYKNKATLVEEKPENNNRPINYANQILLELLQSGLLADKIHRKYFCVNDLDDKTCNQVWGGYGATEFQRRNAFDDFINSGLYDNIMKTATVLNREIYIRQKLILPKYDFDKKAFPLKFNPQLSGWFMSTGTITTLKTDELLLRMNNEEAEALKERLKKQNPNSYNFENLYLVYKVEILKNNYLLNNKFSNPNYIHELYSRISDPIIEIYEDLNLKIKLTEFDLTGNFVDGNLVSQTSLVEENTVVLKDIKLNDSRLNNFSILAYKGIPLIGEITEVIKRFSIPGIFSTRYDCYGLMLDMNRNLEIIRTRKPPDLSRGNEYLLNSSMDISGIANNYIVDALSYLTTDHVYKDFFCNDNNCSGKRFNKLANAYDHPQWGGPNTDEFRKYESYKKFENSGLEQYILKAAETIPKDCYLVTKFNLKPYDFKKESYDIIIQPNNINISQNFGSFEDKDKNKGIELEYKISPQKAKALTDKLAPKYGYSSHDHPTLHCVLKVKLLDKIETDHDQTSSIPRSGYYEIDKNSPVELYEDATLFNKIATLPIK